jgi:hypothetical protein
MNSKNAFPKRFLDMGVLFQNLCQEFEISKPPLQILEGKTFGAL